MADQIDPAAFNAFEAAGWEQRAAGYHQFFGRVTSRLIEPLLEAAAIGAGLSVLDVCTGPGYVAAAAHERGARVVGVDVSPSMLELAAKLHPDIEFERGDAERLPFADASFDRAVVNFGILHLGRPEHAVAELRRVLAPGGRVALSVWNVPSRCRLMGVLLDAIEEAGAEAPAAVPAGPDYFRYADPGEMSRLLEEAGFCDPEMPAIEFEQEVGDIDELWRGVVEGTVRMGAMVAEQLPETQKRIRSVLSEHLERAADEGGRISLDVSVRIGAASVPGP